MVLGHRGSAEVAVGLERLGRLRHLAHLEAPQHRDHLGVPRAVVGAHDGNATRAPERARRAAAPGRAGAARRPASAPRARGSTRARRPGRTARPRSGPRPRATSRRPCRRRGRRAGRPRREPRARRSPATVTSREWSSPRSSTPSSTGHSSQARRASVPVRRQRKRRPRHRRRRRALHVHAEQVGSALLERLLDGQLERGRRGRAAVAAAHEPQARHAVLDRRAAPRCRRATPCRAAPGRAPRSPAPPTGTGWSPWISSRLPTTPSSASRGAGVGVERREQPLEALAVQLEHRARQVLREPARGGVPHTLQLGGEPLDPLLELGYSHHPAR